MDSIGIEIRTTGDIRMITIATWIANLLILGIALAMIAGSLICIIGIIGGIIDHYRETS